METKNQQHSAERGGSTPPAGLKKVTLKKDHEHGRQKYAAGDVIEVNEADEAFLREHNVI